MRSHVQRTLHPFTQFRPEGQKLYGKPDRKLWAAIPIEKLTLLYEGYSHALEVSSCCSLRV